MFCGLGGQDPPHQESTKKIQNYIYQPTQPVGQGNFSEVFKGVNENNGRPVAIKVIKYSSLTSRVAEQLLKNQIDVLKEVNHENILKCHEVLTSKNNCYIITEYYEGGDLEKALHKRKKFPQKEISKLILDIYQGLLYLNSISVVHRDLKVANIFLTANGTPKIADFGFAVKAAQPFKDINIGSPIYMSPEGLLLHQYGPKTDVWSFGILAYELIHGDTPLAGCRSENQLKERVLLPPKFTEPVSSELKHFINLCMTVDPRHRIDIRALSETPYIRRCMAQLEGQKIPKQMVSTTFSTAISSSNFNNIVKDVRSYEQGLAILQYCRLIHKTCEIQPSQIFSQWLLNICARLQWMQLQKNEKNEKLITIVKNYYSKYRKSHQDHKLEISFQDVMRECHRFLNDHTLNKAHCDIRLLAKETELLRKYSEHKQLHMYVKNTHIEKYLEQRKNTYNFPK